MPFEDDPTPAIGADPVPLLATCSNVLFPGAFVPFVLPRGDVERVRAAPVFVVACVRAVGGDPYRDASVRREDLYDIGCLARVRSREEAASGTTLIVQGIARVRLDSLIHSPRGPEATIMVARDDDESDDTIALSKTVRSLSMSIIDRMPELPAEAQSLVESVDAPGELSDLIADNLDVPFTDKIALLQVMSAAERLRRLVPLLARTLEILELRTTIGEKVRAELAGRAIDGDARKTILALQKSALLEELAAEETSVARKKGLLGSLRAALGFAPRAGAVEDVDALRARMRPELLRLQIAAVDAELDGC